jgi:uncharacterized protein (TIGR02145 family)
LSLSTKRIGQFKRKHKSRILRMKKLFPLVIITIIAFASCKKNGNEPRPAGPGTSAADTNSVMVSGTAYPTVHIGGKTWTSLNYNGPGGLYNTAYAEWGGEIHGKLYTPEEAAQIVLPAGWRIPTSKDYLSLLIARGATLNSDSTYSTSLAVVQSLMTPTGWQESGGNNYSGFSAVPTGFYHQETFYGTGNGASFLHSITPGAEPDLAFTIGPGLNGQPLIFLELYLVEGDRCSLRFVKDN